MSARTPSYESATACARAGSRSATATRLMSSSRRKLTRYWAMMAPQPMIPTFNGLPTAGPFR